MVQTMKRFTATEKWDDPWFWELSPPAKLLWLFLCDHCDGAGIIDLNTRFASMKIGLTVNKDHLSELQSRLHDLPCGKLLIVGFIRFQFGSLSRDCKPHNPIFASLSKHGLDLAHIETLSKPFTKGLNTLQDKDKDKEEEKDKKGGVGGITSNDPSPSDILKARLCAWFNRRLTTPWSEKEERALRAVMALETPVDDLSALEEWYVSDAPYKRKDIPTLLNNWNGEIDRAKEWKKNGNRQILKPTDRNFGTGQDPTEVGRITAAAIAAAGH